VFYGKKTTLNVILLSYLSSLLCGLMANEDDYIIRDHYFTLGYFKSVQLLIELNKINYGKI